jgi:hypothetical protein
MRRRPALATLFLVSAMSFLSASTDALAASPPLTLLGNSRVANLPVDYSAGMAQAFAFTATGAGRAGAASVYVVHASRSAGLAVGLYADSHGQPGKLLASGSDSALAARRWNKVTLGSTPTVAKGRRYWLAVLGEGHALELRGSDLGSRGYLASSRAATVRLPATWRSQTRSSFRSLSAYVSGTPELTTRLPSSAPVDTTLPTISGQAVQGQTLTAAPGSWKHSPTSYAYQWEDCSSTGEICFNISGATAGSYVPTSGDVNDGIRVVVTAKNSAGSASATSAATAPIASSAANGPVLLLGNPTVEATADSDSAGSAEAFKFTASSAGSAQAAWLYVSSGSSATGLTVGVYADNGGQPGTLLAVGKSSSLVAGAWNDTALATAPTLASGGTYWLAVLGTGGTLSFRDLRSASSCSQNSGQSTLTSLPAAWTAGPSWSTCSVSAFVAGASQTGPVSGPPPTSPPPPPAAPVNSALPAISGQTIQGSALTTSDGTWSNSPTSYTYQWQDCNTSGAACTNISGATSSTYTLAGSDVGDTLRAVVTATNSGGSAPATSAASAAVTANATPPPPPAAPVNSALPAISGQTIQDSVLTTSNGTWSNSPTSYTYQWQDCNTSGAACTNISGATSSTYTLASSDVGDTLRAVVTATNSGGSASATSAASAAVTAPSSSGSVPCALTAAAGDNGTTSCWATHTGVENGTGFTEAQILAGQSTLRHVVGDQTITTAGTVISDEWISGCIAIDANNVTIKDTLVYPNGDTCSGGGGGSQPSAINDGQNNPPTGTLIEDTTVDGNNESGDQYGISLVGGVCLRCNAFGFAKEFWADGSAASPTLFQDSYAHDFSSNTGTAHLDSIFLDSSSYVTIEHSYVVADGTNNYVAGAVVSGSDYGPANHQIVDDSYMEGDSGQDWHGACGAVYMQMTNDAFSSDEKGSGPWLSSDAGNTWSGNYVAGSPSSVYTPPPAGSC